MIALLLAISLAAQAQTAEAAQGDTPAQAQQVVNQLASGAFPELEAQLTARMKAALPPGGMETVWKSITAQFGALQKQLGAREQQLGALKIGIVTCVFEKATLDVNVVFDAQGHVAGLNLKPAGSPAAPYTLPPYADAASFTEQPVTVGSGEWPLPGTLSMPRGDGPFPLAVLVHGSGANDRDETLFTNKPFRDLASGLASRGVAVLRYDKRAFVYAGKMATIANLTVKQDVTDDVAAAVALARLTPKIDPKRVFVLGHSMGGMLIPRIGAADPALAGLIVMAGPARTLEQAIVDQYTYLALEDGVITPEEQKHIDEAKRSLDRIHNLTAADAGTRVGNAPGSYWLDLRGYDPPIAATMLQQPILVLQGGRDYQVTPEEFARWKQALEAKRSVTFHLYPALNHLFIAGEGKSYPAEYEKSGHVDPQVIDDIATWVKSQVVRR